MNLKNLMVDTKSAWIEYPGLEGFEVELVNLGREKLMALRKSCMITKFNKGRQATEELDEKKFIRKFTDATIIDWKGLKLKYLEEFVIVDLTGQDPESELEYSAENAHLLISNSGDFDTWLNDAVFDLSNFRTGRDRPTVESVGEVAE